VESFKGYENILCISDYNTGGNIFFKSQFHVWRNYGRIEMQISTSDKFTLANLKIDSAFLEHIQSFSFDRENTKLIAKNGEELKVDLLSGTQLIGN